MVTLDDANNLLQVADTYSKVTGISLAESLLVIVESLRDDKLANHRKRFMEKGSEKESKDEE